MSLGLLQFCERIAAIDRGQIPSRSEAIAWLAKELHRNTGAAVAVWLTELVGGELLVDLDTPTRFVTSPGPTGQSTIPARELTFFGRPADLIENEAPTSDAIHDGPHSWSDFTLAEGERAMLFRLRLEFALCWIRVTGTKSLLADATPWRNLLPPAIHSFLRGVNHDERLRFRKRQEDFYDKLLVTKPRELSQMFGELCMAWQELSGSLWAWLWLYNPISDAFELTASASDKGINHDVDMLIASQKPSKTSVAAYASITGRVTAVSDPQNWRGYDEKGREYKTAIAEVIAKMGGGGFVCVPVIVPPATLGAAKINCEISGSICLHFPHLADMPSLPFRGLLRMGQATAQSIMIGFMSRHNEILLALNEMAGRYQNRTESNPIADRAEYLKNLIELIQKFLHFRCISVFYKVPFLNEVECLATTGIHRRDGTPIHVQRLAEARYRSGEGRTGKCFANCNPLEFTEKDLGTEAFIGAFYEVDPETKKRGEPFVLYPIPNPADPKKAMGVLRCVSQPKLNNRFLKLELEPLGFIAQQVGVALQALDIRIRREQTISIVKHDLYSPLTMIRHTVDRMRDDEEVGLPPREYDLANLDNSAFFAINLVSQLDLGPDQFGDYFPEPTFIEGDILARVVSMLRPYAMDHRKMQIKFDNIRVIPKLNVDRGMIERAIHNLLVNAIKYGTPKTTILIEGRKARAGYCLDVKNEGIGIEPEEIEFIGQLHYRSPKAKTVGMGLGYGVFIARNVMQKHGGELFLTSRIAPTTFSLFFPIRLAL